MPSDIYWIDAPYGPRLAIMARPRAGDWLEDEVDYWQRSGIETVVSLLEQDEVRDLQLEDERELCVQNGIAFFSFPIRDRGLPEDRAAALRFARELAGSDKPIAIHCRAGIGRSSLMAAAILIETGIPAETALRAIATARGLQVPDTDAQRDWILDLTRQS